QRPLRARPLDPRRREQPALRPDVRLARQHRHPRLRGRSPAHAGAGENARLAGASRMKRLAPLLLVVFILAAWEIVARSGVWNPILFPSLARIANELFLF